MEFGDCTAGSCTWRSALGPNGRLCYLSRQIVVIHGRHHGKRTRKRTEENRIPDFPGVHPRSNSCHLQVSRAIIDASGASCLEDLQHLDAEGVNQLVRDAKLKPVMASKLRNLEVKTPRQTEQPCGFDHLPQTNSIGLGGSMLI